MGVVSEQNQGSQAGGTDGIAFGHGLGGVAYSVQRVGDLAYAGRQLGHFGDAACVVGDRSVGVERYHDASHAEHGRCGNRDAVQSGQ